MIIAKQSKLSSPIIYEGNDINDMLSAGMDHFYNCFLKKEIKPKFQGKDIFFDMNKFFKQRIQMPFPISFMHITSLDNDDKYSIFPCTNDISMELCQNQCSIKPSFLPYATYNRWECLYRLHRIHWIPEIIALANAEDNDVNIFSENKTDGYKNFVDINIRYKCGMDDYLIVLRERDNDYLFITAFPVVSKKKKEQLDIKTNKKAGSR